MLGDAFISLNKQVEMCGKIHIRMLTWVGSENGMRGTHGSDDFCISTFVFLQYFQAYIQVVVMKNQIYKL